MEQNGWPIKHEHYIQLAHCPRYFNLYKFSCQPLCKRHGIIYSRTLILGYHWCDFFPNRVLIGIFIRINV